MSELTLCNFCSLHGITARATRDGKVVQLRPGGIGVYVHVLKPEEPLDTRPWDDGNAQIVASMMEIGTQCGC